MSKIDLGYTPDYLTDCGPCNPVESKKGKRKEKPPIVYPSIHLEGDPAKAIGNAVETNGEFTALVTFRVVSKREQAERDHGYHKESAGCHVELELRSVTSNKLKEGDGDEKGESAEEAVDEFFGK
jgi:hypothetical protein